jgi:hypothetical protein
MRATDNRRTAVRKLTEAKAKLARWRAGCRGPGRIPNRLWMLAAEAAAEVGVEHAAFQLDVSATRLREWVEQRDGRVAPTETTTPDFIELAPMPLPTAGECVVEVAEPSGRKVQVALKGPATARLPEVLRALCAREVVT